MLCSQAKREYGPYAGSVLAHVELVNKLFAERPLKKYPNMTVILQKNYLVIKLNFTCSNYYLKGLLCKFSSVLNVKTENNSESQQESAMET